MAEPREVRVKLTADVSEYVAGMAKARRATRRVTQDRLWTGYVVLQAGLFGALVTVTVQKFAGII